jgi:hypothetical protein
MWLMRPKSKMVALAWFRGRSDKDAAVRMQAFARV